MPRLAELADAREALALVQEAPFVDQQGRVDLARAQRVVGAAELVPRIGPDLLEERLQAGEDAVERDRLAADELGARIRMVRDGDVPILVAGDGARG